MQAQKQQSEAREPTFDRDRGIRNVSVVGKAARAGNDAPYTNPHGVPLSSYESYGEAQNDEKYTPYDAHSVEKRFREQESLGARAYKKRNTQKKRDLEGGEVANDMEYVREEAQQAFRNQILNARKEARLKGVASVSKLKKLSTFRSWMGISVVATASFWIFICGLISLIGFGMQALISDFFNNNALGGFIKWATSFIGNIENLFPVEYIGWGFWGIATITAYGLFVAYLLYYSFMGINVFKTTTSSLITFLCLALAILPVTNLIPSLLIWVIYINTTSLFSSE